MTAVTVPWRRDRPQRMQDVCCAGGVCLVAEAKGFNIGNDPPAIFNSDGRMQRRLASFGNAVADVFEEYTGRAVLDFGAAQIGRQRGKALTDTAIAIVLVAMALGAIGQKYAFSSGDDSRLGHI